MRTPMMDQDNQYKSMTGSQSSLSGQQHEFKPRRSNSTRDHSDSDKEDQKSRTSSTAQSDVYSDGSRYSRTKLPVKEAVQSALNSENTPLPSDIINQITAQVTASVLQQLKASQQSPPTAQSSTNTQEQMDALSSAGGSPPLDRGKVYTPPSPYRASEEAAQTGSPPSPRKPTKMISPPNSRRPTSPTANHNTAVNENEAKERSVSRPPIERSSTGGDATIVEKIWGKLFNEQGEVTVRLSQFLRGIAVHLIEDYEPKHSLVIGPEKMQKYYQETKLASEIYPWQVIFDDRTSSISRMFREIEAQHHLTQDRLHERPDIPGLTPVGFETWMTLLLKAHPNEEFERLAYTALNMPVSNPDDRKERFPKELSRRQFPKEGDDKITQKLQKVMYMHCGVKIQARSTTSSEKDTKSNLAKVRSNESTTSASVPPPTSIPQGPPLQKIPTGESSLSQVPTRSDRGSAHELRQIVSDTAISSDDDHTILPQPIERERKPYVAQPGGGKNYDKVDAPASAPASAPAPPDMRSSFSTSAPVEIKPGRSGSVSGGRPSEVKARPAPISIHQQKASQGQASAGPSPADVHSPTRTRSGSSRPRDIPQGNRNRSPSISRGIDRMFSRADGDVTYGSFHSTNPDYMPNSWRSDKYPTDRSDQRQSFSADPGDRGSRQRFGSVSSNDGQRHHYGTDEDYYRSATGSYPGPDSGYGQQYPPNSYRSRV